MNAASWLAARRQTSQAPIATETRPAKAARVSAFLAISDAYKHLTAADHLTGQNKVAAPAQHRRIDVVACSTSHHQHLH